MTLAVVGLVLVAAIFAACGMLRPGAPAGVVVPAGAPLPIVAEPRADDEPVEPPSAALAPPGGAIVQAGVVRIPKPSLAPGPRRVGIQVGHWKTDEVPDELSRLEGQTGTSWDGLSEVEVSLDIAQRVASLLRSRDVTVDILPTTIPAGYLADAFLALHSDGDGVGERSGFKIAHGSRRGPYENDLVRIVREEYAAGTGLGWDDNVGRAMTGYFGFSWSRYQHATAPHTPSAILEMGYLSNDGDRDLLTEHPETVAQAITNGILRFLDEYPRAKLFGEDLVLPIVPFRPASPSSH
ncbi:MAG TPA: N-acetylmuramoyl-L-alanine amidase [Candidatus Limnocylindria bacterium]|nr:N-acetylmuramoyl-L-alanine amidase [Candidatus Limnocylindria bacterium]